MDQVQLTHMITQNAKDISALSESIKAAHKRIDENGRITEGIHKIAANVEALALQVKMLTEKLDASVSRIDAGQRAQGERIGALEKKPAARWESLVGQLIAVALAGVVSYVIARIF